MSRTDELRSTEVLSAWLAMRAGVAEADNPERVPRYHNAAATIRAVREMGGFTDEEMLVALCRVTAEYLRRAEG